MWTLDAVTLFPLFHPFATGKLMLSSRERQHLGVLCLEDSWVWSLLFSHAQYYIMLLFVGESHVWMEGHPIHLALIGSHTLHKWGCSTYQSVPEHLTSLCLGTAVAAGPSPRLGSCLDISNRTADESREAHVSREIHFYLQWCKNVQATTLILDCSLDMWLTLRSLCDMDHRMGKKSIYL